MALIKWQNATTKLLLLATAALTAWPLLACKDDTKPNTGTLQRPSDFVQSGRGLADGKPEYIFIADSAMDFVTVLDATVTYDNIEYVWSPVFYFPIMIPAGEAPSALSTTSDGRLVLVASAQTGSLQLLDTDKLQMVESPNNREALWSSRIIDHRSAVSQLLWLENCGAQCDKYLAVANDAVVKFTLTYQLDSADQPVEPAVRIDAVYEAGPAPIRAVYHAGSGYLWLAQNIGTELWRLDIATGQMDRFDVGRTQQDIAVSTDGNTIFLAHAASRTVAVYTGATGVSLTHVNNDSRYQPPDGSSDVHDIFVRDIPWRLTFIHEPTLTLDCLGLDDSGESVETIKKSYKDYVVVASLMGATSYIVPQEEEGSATTYGVANTRFCLENTVTKKDEPQDGTSWWLATCNSAERPGTCYPETGVTVFHGYQNFGYETEYKLVYEADLTLGFGELGRGQVDEAGRFWVDTSTPITSTFMVKMRSGDLPGDQIIITSTPDNNPADCITRYGTASEIDKRTFTILSEADGHYEVTPAIDQQCFDDNSKGVTYEIRAANSFLVLARAASSTSDYSALGRMQAGQTFGSGGNTGEMQGVKFTLDSQACAVASCQRDATQSFIVHDYFTPLRGAYFSTSTLPTIGSSPVEMRLGNLLGIDDGEYVYKPILLLLYSGSGAQTAPGLMLLTAFNSSALQSSATYYFFD